MTGLNENTIPDTAAQSEEGVIRIRKVHEEKYYDVWIVKLDDMPAMTYGIVNRATEVIENLQPILANAKTLAKEFSGWLDGGSQTEGALRLMSPSRDLN